ncbi:SCO family protein [Parasalinivibrio latis]|uniref:SCO family protein n=1 Tax=Parasalinivibrio latis TaxID=2952610 RepID=UPI0030E43CA5
MKKLGIVFVVALLAGFGVRFGWENLNQSEINSPDIGVLQTANGTLNLFDGNDPRTRIVYFGYTHCPDVCPTSLAILSAALKKIPETELDNFWPVFISLDPARDDGNQSDTYAGYFHPTMSGASGTEEQTAALAKKYGVLYQISKLEDSELEYAVDHSSYFYFLNPQGELVEKVPHTLNPDLVVAAIKRTLSQKQ